MSGLRLLVTGGSGQVGGAVAALAAARGFAVAAPPRSMLNLADAAGIAAYLAAHPVDAIVNCAAFTAVDLAETEREQAFACNAAAPGMLAQLSAERNIPLIHVSTDYVFDGSKRAPYEEGDSTGPINVYGASKLAGEQAIAASGCRHAILRTAWVMSAEGKNFLNTMLRLGAERDAVAVVGDQFGCPTAASDIAEGLLALTRALTGRTVDAGIWHFVNGGQTSWHDLAAFIFARAAAAGLKTPTLGRIGTEAYPTPARRPANSVLATHRFTQDFGIAPRDWQTAIGAILDQRFTRTAL